MNQAETFGICAALILLAIGIHKIRAQRKWEREAWWLRKPKRPTHAQRITQALCRVHRAGHRITNFNFRAYKDREDKPPGTH